MSFKSDDDDEDDIEPLRPLKFNRPDDYGGDIDDQRTNQADMDRLMKPCLDFEDDDDEENNDNANPMKLSDLIYNLKDDNDDDDDDDDEDDLTGDLGRSSDK